MKAIEVLLDEPLLKQLDADEEVRKFGRCAILRRAAKAYLRRARARRIAEQYPRAYAGGKLLGRELEGWEAEGVCPVE